MKNTEQLTTSTFYHIYNRAVNEMNIFESDGNFQYFLQKYSDHISPIANTYAYCLLNNHFHFLVQTKDEDEIINGLSLKEHKTKSNQSLSTVISLQFSHFFNGYTQAFNRQFNRKGKLFELPFRRISVLEEGYFRDLYFISMQIHSNMD